MLYTYQQLQNLSYEDTQTPYNRYIFKYYNHRKEIKKLKAHEKDFLFINMYIIRDQNNNKVYDLYTIPEAAEYLFNKLIMIYSHNLDFNKPTLNQYRKIIDSVTMQKDKQYFDNYYASWINELKSRKGKYLSIIYTELNKILKEFDHDYHMGRVKKATYIYHTKYLHVVAFFIYYKVKLFFDGLADKYVVLNTNGEKIIINIYSYVHILYRHYFPSMNLKKIDRSINIDIPYIDIENLPFSLKDFLKDYFAHDTAPLDATREYLLFAYKGLKHIIWIKYHKLEELNNDYGFELRTIYLCKEARDISKFNNTTEHIINPELSLFF
ncbi:hypothetical protein LJC29_01585 [Bacteroides sp. OttesenSCG-928-N06]|nr:hypothetical protein [Bacteroides sp. OttesenSCG-928-N06]